MSRYELRGREPHVAVVVGWDAPLSTFFAQIWDEKAVEFGNPNRCCGPGATPGKSARSNTSTACFRRTELFRQKSGSGSTATGRRDGRNEEEKLKMENAINENEFVNVNYCYGVEVINCRLTELTWGAMDLDLHVPAAVTAAAAAKCRLGMIDDGYDFDVDRRRQLTVLVAYFFAQGEQAGNPLLFEAVLDADSADPRPVSLKGMLARDLAGGAFYVFMLPEEG